jgi:hypothetical protein
VINGIATRIRHFQAGLCRSLSASRCRSVISFNDGAARIVRRYVLLGSSVEVADICFKK